MRFVVYGTGAIGGAMAGRLALAGKNVVAIARGAQLEAIRRGGLRVRTPSSDDVVRLQCVASPSDLEFGADDVILLTMKTQDTKQALEDLKRAGASGQAIICLQNATASFTRFD